MPREAEFVEPQIVHEDEEDVRPQRLGSSKNAERAEC
jgi:hypothetical protein